MYSNKIKFKYWYNIKITALINIINGTYIINIVKNVSIFSFVSHKQGILQNLGIPLENSILKTHYNMYNNKFQLLSKI